MMDLPNGRRDGPEDALRMRDLIDLNSPDVRGEPRPARLASPLIPAPTSVGRDDADGTSPELAAGRREGDGNNPFDRVLRETAEYVSRKGDPFEVMLQRALRFRERRNPRESVDFTDDFTPRRKRCFKTMNKTDILDESSLESRFGSFDGDRREAKVESIVDEKDANVRDGSAAGNAPAIEQEHEIPVAESNPLELSILNQSAMNDTLLEIFPKSRETGRVSPFSEKDASFEGFIFPSNVRRLEPPNIQRSLSQGAEESVEPTRLFPHRRSRSVTDGQRKGSQGTVDSTVSSFLDRGFLESKSSEQSVFSSLSSLSARTKLTSASLSSSILSNNPMNHAFLDDGSLKTSQEKISATESSVEIKLRQYDLSDLAERLSKLRCAMNDMIGTSSVAKDDSDFMKEGNNKRITNNRLIDVDVFMPEQNKEFNRSSSSTCSSDSIFTNTSKVDKSILNEAKVLAKTFEELTFKTDSGSNMDDDLISSNTLWMSELLPAFDEPLVDDLIDLPVSPERNLRDITNNDKKESPASIDSTGENLLKKLESPFTSVSVIKQNITSLLSDLRKLIKTESNPEAKKLLDNLENILDVNYKNNTELLVNCLNISNKSQSPQKISSDSEKFDKSSTSKSKEESDKLSQEKLCNNEKSLPNINHTLEDTSQDSSDKSSVTSSSCKDKEDRVSTINSSGLTEHNKLDEEKDRDKKIAIELLINLQKLLSGQVEDDTTIQLLKNIGKVLNIALNNNIENKMQTSGTRKQNIQQTTSVTTSESGRNSLSTKVAHRRSLDPKSKTVRRSISAIESSPKNISNTQRRRHNNTLELENRQQRSSEPGFINNVSNKKLAISEAYNRRAEATKSDSKKEKSIAISDVKNKLKKRSDVVNKRGPMKAVHPVDNMQKKRASLGKQMPFSQITTPPKSNKATPLGNKIISSTPNSTDNNYISKKSKSKPIASSTPDSQNSKSAPLSAKKRNLSCDISPVTTYVNTSGSDERKDSPKRTSKLPTPRKCVTPTRQDAFGIPRFLTPPRHYSSRNGNNRQSSQRLNRSLINFQQCSPVNEKKNVARIQQSPLKESNRITAKVKPLNLISKIKRHNTSDFAEKENNYA